MIKSNLTKTLGALGAFVPSMPEVSLTRDAEVTLYMVHHSGDAEDYTFLIDFTAFMAESQSGVFSRPVDIMVVRRDTVASRSTATRIGNRLPADAGETLPFTHPNGIPGNLR